MIDTATLRPVVLAVRLYLLVTAATVVTLAILAVADPHLATSHAWGHAVIVAVFAVLLPLRLRPATAGRRSGLRAVGIISGVLFAVNVVEALVPGFLPTWMRLEMGGVAVLMAVIVLLVIRTALASSWPGTSAPCAADRRA